MATFRGHFVAALAMLTIISPIAALADDDYDDYLDDVRDAQKKQIKHFNRAQRNFDRAYWNTHWGNTWDNQRNWYGYQFRNMSARRASARQRMLENQLRDQYVLYHSNTYTGPYGWTQYSDPAFIDYVHVRNPGLLTQLRSIIGF